MTLPHLRPLSTGEILDGAFSLYRRHFVTLFVTALLPYIPLILFWIGFGVFTSGGLDSSEQAANLSSLLLLPYTIPASVLVWGALIHQVSRAYLGGDASVREGFARAARRVLPLLVAAVVALLLIGLGFVLLVVPGIVLTLMFFAVFQVVVIEDRGPIEALGRSRDLARGAWGQIFLVLLLVILITSLPGMALGAAGVGAMLASPGAAESADSSWFLSLMQAASLLVGALTTPYLAAVMVLLYYDRRVRSEALDVELAAEGLAQAG